MYGRWLSRPAGKGRVLEQLRPRGLPGRAVGPEGFQGCCFKPLLPPCLPGVPGRTISLPSSALTTRSCMSLLNVGVSVCCGKAHSGKADRLSNLSDPSDKKQTACRVLPGSDMHAFVVRAFDAEGSPKAIANVYNV